jgi:hypothetical protein
VTFNSAGGTEVAAQKVEEGGLAERPADPEREGYEFLGWFIVDIVEAYDFGTPVYGDLLLWAYWKDITVTPVFYTVTFNSAGGSYVAPHEVEHGSLVVKPADPQRWGYEFAGWYYIYEDNDFAFNFDEMLVGWEITLTAKWTPGKHLVTFDSAGGSYVAPQEVEHGGLAVKPANPQRWGYVFAGWYYIYEDNDFAFNFDGMRVSWGITLTAKWLPIVTTVVNATPTAHVTVLPGNQNILMIIIIEELSNGTRNSITKTFMIANNSAGTYQVGDYMVYVDTKGNDQIRDCYIVLPAL